VTIGFAEVTIVQEADCSGNAMGGEGPMTLSLRRRYNLVDTV
jgi:hypothetical protein